MKRSVLAILIILTLAGLLGIGGAYLYIRNVGTIAVETAGAGTCFDEKGLPIVVSTRSDCLEILGGDLWLASGPTITSGTPTPTPAASTPPPTAPSYLSDPFGNWTEPGRCLSGGKREFFLYEYEQALDCFAKVEDPLVCDYLNECFSDQKSLDAYLKS